MQANIFIVGDIGKYKDSQGNQVDGVVLLDVIEQVQKYPNAENFKLNINTCGGSIYEGYKIIEYLQSIGKPIHTCGFGVVASMGTLLFLLGEKRELKQGTDFFIHLPQGGVLGDSETIMDYANEMAELQKKVLKQYKDVTNLTDEALLPLLRDETTLTFEQAYNLGFANYKSEALQPVAHFQKNTNTNINNEMSTTAEQATMSVEDKNWFKGLFEPITKALANLGKETPKNVMETTADGETMIDFPEIEQGQPISVGATATIDGSPAEGEYVMPSGMTFVFVAGELTEIREPASEEITDEEMNQMIADIKKQLAVAKENEENLQAQLKSEKNKNKRLSTDVEKIRSQLETFETELKSRFKFETVINRREGDSSEEVESEAKKAMSNLKKHRKNNR